MVTFATTPIQDSAKLTLVIENMNQNGYQPIWLIIDGS